MAESDFSAVVPACISQAFSHFRSIGIAIEGHCISVRPRPYLFCYPATTVAQATRDANVAMPKIVVALVEKVSGLSSGLNSVVLAAANRGDVMTIALSGVFTTGAILESRRGIVGVYVPLCSDFQVDELDFQPLHRGEVADAVITWSDHG